MKPVKILLFITCCLVTVTTFAQSPKAIEADLLKSFKKISYWDDKQREGVGNAADSLDKANEVFAAKLKSYTVKYPSTITEPFSSLKKERLDVYTSTDSLFRIYSWDTWTGGTMHQFANVMQYKVGQKTRSILLTGRETNNVPYYSNLYTFINGNKTYYLGIYGTIYSTKDAGTGIKIFSIENGTLNSDTKIIKTQSGLKSKLYYSYDFFSVVDIPFEKRPTITFDAETKTIKMPLVVNNYKMTQKFITYKFNGRYFGKVKN